MRVLALVTEAYGGRGGIAQYNRDLLEAIAAHPEVRQVCVLPRDATEVAAHAPVGVVQLPMRADRLGYAARAVALAASMRPDLILCGHLYMAPLAAAIALPERVPVWLQLHGIDAWQHSTAVRRWAAERCALLTCVSRYTRARLLSWCNVTPERVRVLPDTVDPRFTPGAPDPQLAQRLGIAGHPVILTVGRIAASERYKGHDRVLRCLPRLLERHPTLTYAIAGDGDDRPRLDALASELGVRERVRFLGYVPDSDLPALYRLADVFVMPSTGEGFGIVYLQALASGTSVIAGSDDASRDPLQDGRHGRLVDPSSIDALTAAIDAELTSKRRPTPDATAAFCRDHFRVGVGELLSALAGGRFDAEGS